MEKALTEHPYSVWSNSIRNFRIAKKWRHCRNNWPGRILSNFFLSKTSWREISMRLCAKTKGGQFVPFVTVKNLCFMSALPFPENRRKRFVEILCSLWIGIRCHWICFIEILMCWISLASKTLTVKRIWKTRSLPNWKDSFWKWALILRFWPGRSILFSTARTITWISCSTIAPCAD